MTVGTKIGSEATRNEPDTALAGQRDELYHWENALFLVEGSLFKVPRYHFIVGSEWFATKYLRVADRAHPDDWSTVSGESDSERPSHDKGAANGAVVLEDVTASQFRTFLKLLFPIHSTSTTLTLTKPEWLTILSLSTRWHFLEFRGLSIQHLHPQMIDPVEMIQVGRAEYVPRWVIAGYAALVNKPGAISEEESGAIGDRTAVRLYIIRHELGEGGQEERNAASELISFKFREEFLTLKVMEAERRTRLEKAEAERRTHLEKAEAEMVERIKREEEQRIVEEDNERKRLVDEERQRVEEERVKQEDMRRKQQEAKRMKKAAKKRNRGAVVPDAGGFEPGEGLLGVPAQVEDEELEDAGGESLATRLSGNKEASQAGKLTGEEEGKWLAERKGPIEVELACNGQEDGVRRGEEVKRTAELQAEEEVREIETEAKRREEEEKRKDEGTAATVPQSPPILPVMPQHVPLNAQLGRPSPLNKSDSGAQGPAIAIGSLWKGWS